MEKMEPLLSFIIFALAAYGVLFSLLFYMVVKKKEKEE